jgi:hypothetical protein
MKPNKRDIGRNKKANHKFTTFIHKYIITISKINKQRV